eukprot:5480-Heterococcus_DN1.PRE.2
MDKYTFSARVAAYSSSSTHNESADIASVNSPLPAALLYTVYRRLWTGLTIAILFVTIPYCQYGIV